MKIHLAASGDLRSSANQACWPAQEAMERELASAIQQLGHRLVRAHPYDTTEKHGFIASQRQGLDIFAQIPPDEPIIIAESVWQYSHHIYPGLISHRGPILTVANWSGQWPGLVGMLNLNGSLTKAGIPYSTLWDEDFSSSRFLVQLGTWIQTGLLTHDESHVRSLEASSLAEDVRINGENLAEALRRERVILGIFDEGCMGMFNAIIPDELLFPLGVFKERLSQSVLYHAMTQVPAAEAEDVYTWLIQKGFTFRFGHDPSTDLTREQILQQCRMYIAACRIGDAFGCEAIGIQYQQGLKDLCSASDLAEGLLNNSERPPVQRGNGSIIREGEPYVHFNEVDECAGLDAVLTRRTHAALAQPVETTLHDVRWGDWDRSGTVEDYVWVFEISGGAPPAHHLGGYAGSMGERQPPMYFPLGGSSLKGIAKPGEIIWSRIWVAPDGLHMDIGRGKVVELPQEETERRWRETTSQWPIMHAVLHGVSRDQMMARHKANHIQVAYANSASEADRTALTKAAMAQALGLRVFLCGELSERRT